MPACCSRVSTSALQASLQERELKEVLMFFESLHDLLDETCLFSYFLLVFCRTRLPVHFYCPPIYLLSNFIPPSKSNLLSKPLSALPSL